MTSAWVYLLAGAAVLAACGKSDDKKAASQVAATVNSEEITVHQVNNVLARNPNITPEAAPRAKREIVERLVDQELARQQALEKKLDRSPNVVQAIEAAKTEILARAYLQEVAAAQAKPTPEEVTKYYAEHPELFSQRRLYMLEEIAVASKDGIAAALRERVAKAKSMQEIADWLKAREVQYAVNRGGRAAEQIPLEMLPKLQKMKDGEIQVIEAADHLNVIRVLATKAAPVDETTAAPRIQQFLFNRRSSEVIAEEMKRLKEHAKIEYVGEFAAATPAAAKPAAAAAPKEAASPDASIEKGVRGLQ
jgi:EpsD family peptidyl-prolyl cis-trans isomerase